MKCKKESIMQSSGVIFSVFLSKVGTTTKESVNQGETFKLKKTIALTHSFQQGGFNKKQMKLNLCNMFSIFIFNELCLLV